ncbi:MAG: acyltransferase family protein [Acidimicrobiia bacterium]
MGVEQFTVEGKGLRYQPPLDGLRAVAVLAVLAFHFGGGARGGFLGVDVFMVLSGFLITSLLAIERTNTGHIKLLRFWGRRVRRLFPALILLLLLVALYAYFAAPPEQLSRIRSDGFATLFYVENWHLIFAGTLASPLSHTWSLAIEEQWYIIWPLVFLGLTRLLRGRDWVLIFVVLVLAVASAFDMYLTSSSLHGYYGTDSRAQALLLGAALALLLRIKPGPVRPATRAALEVAGVVGFVVFLLMAFRPPSWMNEGGFFLVAVASAFVIAASVQPQGRALRTFLSLPPLRWIGLVSYGIYLYHFVVLRWVTEGRTGLGVVPLSALRFAITLAIASASYLLVELPVRRGTFLSPRLQVALTPVAIAVVAVLLVVTTTSAPEPRKPTLNERLWQQVRASAPGSRRVLLLGDDEVQELAVAMQGPYSAGGVQGASFGSPTCRLEDLGQTGSDGQGSGCGTWQTNVRGAISAYRPQAIVVLLNARKRSGASGASTSPARAARLQRALRAIHAEDPTAKIVLLTPTCSPTTFAKTSTAADRAWLNAALAESASRNPKHELVVDYGAARCAGGTELATLDGQVLRSTDGSLTQDGARAIWHWIASRLPATP